MIRVTFIDHQNRACDVQADAGGSLMQLAVENGIPGIVAECGGACSCATCVCYVDDAWDGRLGLPSDMERAMLEPSAQQGRSSRLSCQIKLTDDLDGLVVHVPKTQY